MANIGLATDAADALEMKAEGVGLYRTEIELIAAGRLPSEDELTARFATVQEAMGERTIVYRLPDVGSDKPLPFLSMPKEDNPALGWRGARLLLEMPDMIRLTVRAAARAARKGRLHILYPMIADVGQFLRLKSVCVASLADLDIGEVRHGVMFEVPAACLQAEAILQEADFGSIGTNDLIQYLYAVDRNNAQVAGDFDPSKPVLWSVMATVVQAARRLGRDVAVCGEVGADPAFVPRLIELGIDTVSVSARAIPSVRTAAAERLKAKASPP